MKKADVDNAYELARQFMELVDKMRDADRQNCREIEGKKYCYDSPKHHGAVRRRSMDLTRALAEMRRPN